MKKGVGALAVAIASIVFFGGASYAHADLVFDINFPQISSAASTSAPVSGSCDALSTLFLTFSDGVNPDITATAPCAADPENELAFLWSETVDASSLQDGQINLYVRFAPEDPLPAEPTSTTLKDTTPPDISVFVGDGLFSLSTPAEGYIFDTADPLFEFGQNDGDGVSTLTCSVDGATAEDCISFSYQPVGLADGPHTLVLDVTSDIGNTGATTTNFCINSCESEAAAETVHIALRDGTTLIGPITLELPASTTAAVALSPTGTTTTYTVPARSVLAMLTALDATSTDFAITDLAYYPAFSSFIVNCMSVPAASDAEDCYSWTYAVNGAFPSVGMDITELSDGDIAYVFFGSAWQVSVDKTTVEEHETFTATIEKYNAETGAYAPAEGEVAGAVQFDDFFVPTEFATSTTDASGQVTLSVANAGEYAVGAQVVSYYPNVAVTVTEPAAEGAPTSGGGGGGVSHLSFNVPAALAYLASKQSADGSFGSVLLSDWAAIAFAAADPGEAKTRLRVHLISTPPSLSGVQDHIRHSMALMALGIDPYTGTRVDHITPIVSSYDGTQIGDPSLDNDDIFALFPLTHAGYGASDTMIQRIVAFIVSRQQSNGSWTGGADMTAAAIQALSPFTSLPGVPSALTKAEAYLHTQQQNNGGFGSSSATSWAMQAIAALGQPETAWTAGGLYPRDYLATLQQSDGGVEATSSSDLTRIWATEYAIPGATGKTWNALLSNFTKPTAPVTAGGGVATSTSTAVASTTATVAATPTPVVATTTAATGQVLGEIIAAIANEAPQDAYDSRIASVAEPAPTPAVEPLEEPATEKEALEQVAAAATVGDINWIFIVLAFLALVLFGITGYIAFVRKYWR